VLDHEPGQVAHPDRVLLARVRGRRVDVRAATELLDVVETLEVRRVHHQQQEAVERDLPVHSVLDLLLTEVQPTLCRRCGIVHLRHEIF
jgi:hypothetical protein